MAPQALLSHLHRADGSATYSEKGYTIIGSVNGPVEVQRRDELPEEAAIDVNVRPAAGIGSPNERHLETLIQATLRHVILVQNFPRTLIQVTLQVRSLPEEQSTGNGSAILKSSLMLLPHLLNTALLALLSASIPLSTTLTSTVVMILSSGKLLCSPSSADLVRAQSIQSVHVFAFSAQKSLLLAESQGEFDIDEWDEACELAEDICCKETGVAVDEMDVDGKPENLEGFLRDVVREKVEKEQMWKTAP
ncbi:hypothetical protein K432DRAFT_405635 [Lepidopterella palustris CBS 459.81]|uniref:Exoribonuclease phosphorolytic domain-containing protein n=1 Tax=Lepidopterella palustris CBS 459.81 TaxID=1314670 RepID=A0A8E2E8F4_9PEZI|nr:hypothetical protein K432DRAFT_405635 [Lepidopterella palustris CBS 459.81]